MGSFWAWLGHWMLARSRRHSMKAHRWMQRAEKVFGRVKGGRA